MFQLENRELRVELIDPERDRERLGPRFCWGGYIWQVYDADGRALLSGPEFPKPDPLPFNGQGLPESFRHRTRDGVPLTWRGDEGIAIGVGAIAVDQQREVVITAPCKWTITSTTDRIRFETEHAAAGFACHVTREVRLEGRLVTSTSWLRNVGSRPLSLQWFAHPFFPLTDGRVRAELPPGTALPVNDGFDVINSVLTSKRAFRGKDDGQFALLQLRAGMRLDAVLDHPLLSEMAFGTSFVPDECPVWGNAATFSIEPYQTLELAAGEMRQWLVWYRFSSRPRERP